ncbi:K(+)/H(+) antiporter [Rhizophlyctis rosea]|nr:K(+)/H(+) antiporter [Rhizophlyctis rosea]
MSIFTHPNPIAGEDGVTALFLLQVVIIVTASRLLGNLLQKYKQPRVIAEILVGIALGPTALGAIPGFSATLFPQESLVTLQTLAWLGLSFYLFLVGLELDLNLIKANFVKSCVIACSAMGGTFALAAGPIYWLYQATPQPATSFTPFLLFVGIAISSTAFPVLARLLTECRLLHTDLGLTTIAVATVDDFLAWIVIAVASSTADPSGSKFTAIYVLLATLVFAGLLLTLGQKLFLYLLHRSTTSETLSQSMVMLTFAMVLSCGFITELIGVHYIFGCFLAGLIIPHDAGLAVAVTEKVEDFIMIMALPVFFAMSGLKSNFRLLEQKFDWGAAAVFVGAAAIGKVVFGAGSAKVMGMTTSDSFKLGMLMNTRGIVQLIVLNIALESNVISPVTFVIMVFMAVCTTLITSVTITYVIPWAEGKRRLTSERHTTLSVDGVEGDGPLDSSPKRDTRFLLVLPSEASVQPITTFVTLLSPGPWQSVPPSTATSHTTLPVLRTATNTSSTDTTLHLSALRLIELTSRTSRLIMATDNLTTSIGPHSSHHTNNNNNTHSLPYDPVISSLRALRPWSSIPLSAEVARADEWGETVCTEVERVEAGWVVVPWVTERKSEYVNTYPEVVKDICRGVGVPVCIFVDGRGGGSERKKGGVVERAAGRGRSPSPPIGNQHPITVVIPWGGMGSGGDRAVLAFIKSVTCATTAILKVEIVRFRLGGGESQQHSSHARQPEMMEMRRRTKVRDSERGEEGGEKEKGGLAVDDDWDDGQIKELVEVVPSTTSIVVEDATGTSNPLSFLLAKVEHLEGGDLVVLSREVSHALGKLGNTEGHHSTTPYGLKPKTQEPPHQVIHLGTSPTEPSTLDASTSSFPLHPSSSLLPLHTGPTTISTDSLHPTPTSPHSTGGAAEYFGSVFSAGGEKEREREKEREKEKEREVDKDGRKVLGEGAWRVVKAVQGRGVGGLVVEGEEGGGRTRGREGGEGEGRGAEGVVKREPSPELDAQGSATHKRPKLDMKVKKAHSTGPRPAETLQPLTLNKSPKVERDSSEPGPLVLNVSLMTAPDEKCSTSKRDATVSLSMPDTVHALKDQLLTLCKVLEGKTESFPRLIHWHEELQKLVDKDVLPETTIAVVGHTGDGKTTLIHAFLEENESILPKGGLGLACTSAVTELKYTADITGYTAKVHFLSVEEWDQVPELALLLEDLTYGGELSFDDLTADDGNREADKVFVVADIKRAVDSKTGNDYLRKAVRDEFEMGGRSKCITYICTGMDKLPNADLRDAIKKYGLKPQEELIQRHQRDAETGVMDDKLQTAQQRYALKKIRDDAKGELRKKCIEARNRAIAEKIQKNFTPA